MESKLNSLQLLDILNEVNIPLSITKDQIVRLNREITKLSNEPHGEIKDYVNSALHSADYYENYFDKVAAMVKSLINNHNFLQGNKRTAAIVLVSLLPSIDFSDDFLVDLVLEIVRKNLTVGEVSKKIALYAKDNFTLEEEVDYLTKHSKTLKILYEL